MTVIEGAEDLIDALRADGYTDEEIAEELGVKPELLGLPPAPPKQPAPGASPSRLAYLEMPETPVPPEVEEAAERGARELAERLERGPGPGEADDAFRKLVATEQAPRPVPIADRVMSDEALVERMAKKMAALRGQRWAEMPATTKKFYDGLAKLAVAAWRSCEEDVKNIPVQARMDREYE